MTKSIIRHVIPQVGIKELTLYPPADEIYRRFRQPRERNRLIKLRHLGALSHAFPGVRQSRWDYTVTMLFYCDEMRLTGLSSSFRIGRVHFSSGISALQSLALIWNIGHLPGTFSVEKGLIRHLIESNPTNPSDGLNWPYKNSPLVSRIMKAADQFIKSNDYMSISRVLAVNKLLAFCSYTSDTLFHFCEDFAFPFLLDEITVPSIQWPKLSQAFRLIRHLAYLTLDLHFTDISWSLGIPTLFRQMVSDKDSDLTIIDEQIREILSPIERITFDSIYNSPEARRESVLVADLAYNKLNSINSPKDEISRWLSMGLFRELKLGRRPSPLTLKRVASIHLRSHFAVWNKSPNEIEEELRETGTSHPGVFEYKSWNTQNLFEPDELIIDLLNKDQINVDQIGKLFIKLISNVDDLDQDYDDPFALLLKNDLEAAYKSLLVSAIDLSFDNLHLDIEPWPLNRYGLFSDLSIARGRGAIWASNSKLNDNYIRHILHNRSRYIDPSMRERYAELLGLSELRKRLRQSWGKKDLRQRCLIITASVRLRNKIQPLIEFDGGLVTISARSGRMIWYGLETKSAGGNPRRSLERRLRTLGFRFSTYSISKNHAYVEISLKTH